VSTSELAGILSWCLMSLAFIGTRARVRRFNLLCVPLLALVATVCVYSAPAVRGADAIAMITGLVLYWIGLLFLRAMLSRSVSLHMLVCYRQGEDQPTIDERIASRLDDARRYHLVVEDGDRYALSRVGVAVDFVLAGLYQVVGVRE
jgi:hypothetical protein